MTDDRLSMYAHSPHGWVIEDDDDIPSNPRTKHDFYDVVAARLSRRGILKGLMASTVLTMAASAVGTVRQARAAEGISTLTFTELDHGKDRNFHVAPG